MVKETRIPRIYPWECQPLVEENKFVENFLKMYDALGLLTTNEEKENAKMVYVTKHIRRGKPVKAHWRKRPNK